MQTHLNLGKWKVLLLLHESAMLPYKQLLQNQCRLVHKGRSYPIHLYFNSCILCLTKQLHSH